MDRSTARLLGRLEPGDIAVLDHVDLDAATAEGLVACGVAAVVNAAPSISGRYPNLGPGVLVDAGIPLLDAVGEDVFRTVREGRQVRLDGASLWVGDERVASGSRQDAASVAASGSQARAGLAAQLSDLVANATGFLLDERDLLLEGVGIPTCTTEMAGRHVLVVAGAYDAEQELSLLRSYRRERRPVVVGVDGGADLLLSHKIVPDLVVGDLSLMSDKALVAAREVVARGAAPARAEDLGVTVTPFLTAAGSEDMALLLADRAGAAVVVVVGFPSTVEQLLDRGRAGASSSLLVRAGMGERVVGAHAAALLGAPRFPLAAALLLVLSAAVALGVAMAFVGSTGFDASLLDERWRAVVEQLPW